jgi:hypothetical protein
MNHAPARNEVHRHGKYHDEDRAQSAPALLLVPGVEAAGLLPLLLLRELFPRALSRACRLRVAAGGRGQPVGFLLSDLRPGGSPWRARTGETCREAAAPRRSACPRRLAHRSPLLRLAPP